MNILKIAEGAYFVPSYSEQTITPAYDLGTTVQSLGPSAAEDNGVESTSREYEPELPPALVCAAWRSAK
jgi:hypothetical protein